jgi:hypothetical protein
MKGARVMVFNGTFNNIPYGFIRGRDRMVVGFTTVSAYHH